MKITISLSESDVRRVRAFCHQHCNNAFVKQRHDKNVGGDYPEVTRSCLWQSMISCLLTTQQRSGPNTPVTRFISKKPFPLSLRECEEATNVESVVAETITAFGGLRRANKIGECAAHNRDWLENGGWSIIFGAIKGLDGSKAKERVAANLVRENLKGFGPKQSRNMLQKLGVTRHETPLDSRIIKWLNEFGFPVHLTQMALGDPYYYEFALDGFQEMACAAGVYPCVLDAMVFSSFDTEWSEDQLVW